MRLRTIITVVATTVAALAVTAPLAAADVATPHDSLLIDPAGSSPYSYITPAYAFAATENAATHALTVTASYPGGGPFFNVTLTPPTGQEFAPGTYPLQSTADATNAGFAPAGCAITGSLTVLDITHDATPALTSVGVDYNVGCASVTTTSFYSFRWHSTAAERGAGYAYTNGSFATVDPATSSPAITYTFTSTGPGDAVIGPISIAGDNPGDFALTADNCSGQSIPRNSTCTFGVIFSPTASYGRAAELVIPDGSQRVDRRLALTAYAYGPPKAVTATSKNRSDGVQLTWTTPDTAQRPLQYYEVLRGETADTLQSLQQIVPATHTFADRLGSASAPLADHDYVYGVRAHTDHGDGPVATVTGHTPAVAAPVTADAIATIDPAYGAPTFTPRLHRYDGAAGAAVAVTSVASGGLTVTASTAGDTTPLNLQIAGSPYGTELTVASYSHPYYLANEPGMSGCSAQQTDFTISEIAYDSGGAIARMAADYLYRCATGGPPVVGSIRWHSDAPYIAATVTTPAADFPVKVGLAQNLLITYRNLGTTDIHVSGASLAPVSPGGSTSEWSLLSDPCAGATLAPQAQCTSTVRVTAASASHREVLVQFGDDTVLGSHTRKVSVYGVAAPPAPTGLAAVTAGSKGTTITWHQSFPAHATPSQWLLYRKVNSGAYALLKTVPVGTTPTSGKYVDPDLRSGLRSYYVRAVNIAGTGASSATLAVRYGPQPTRSTYAVGLTRRVVVTWLQPISSITAHALTGYAISRVSSSGSLVRLGTRTLTQNFSFPATGLAPGQRITLKVQALYGTQVGPAVSVIGTATSSSLLVVRSDGRLYGRGVTGGSSVSVDQPHTFSYEWLLGHSSPPAFSPDRHYMVCSVYNGAAGYPYQLVVRRTDGAGSPRILTTGGNDDVSPAVSHDGKWVVFTRFTRSTGQYHLYKVPWSGGTPTLIPNSRDLDEPAWSADGKSLFATNIATEAWGLYRLTLGGTRTKVWGTGRNHSPVISPDGKSLAFLTTSATTHQSVLKLMTVATRSVRSLVTAGGTVFSESWTPDSAQIYFVALSVTSDATTLRRINRTGTGSTLLTSLGTKARFVVFEKW